MKESHIVVIEAFDSILSDICGIHFLEPEVSFDSKTKVKSVITKQMKPEKAEALNYMKKVEKRADSIEAAAKLGTANAYRSALDKRRDNLEVKPKINLALKLQVTKQDLVNRPHYQEVAECLEEMLQAAEKGLNYLPKRLNRIPGQIENKAKEDRHKRE